MPAVKTWTSLFGVSVLLLLLLVLLPRCCTRVSSGSRRSQLTACAFLLHNDAQERKRNSASAREETDTKDVDLRKGGSVRRPFLAIFSNSSSLILTVVFFSLLFHFWRLRAGLLKSRFRFISLRVLGRPSLFIHLRCDSIIPAVGVKCCLPHAKWLRPSGAPSTQTLCERGEQTKATITKALYYTRDSDTFMESDKPWRRRIREIRPGNGYENGSEKCWNSVRIHFAHSAALLPSPTY